MLPRTPTLIAALLFVLPTACGTSASDAPNSAPGKSISTPKSAAPASRPAGTSVHPGQPPTLWKGKVIETMNGGSYSYVQLDTGDRKVWLAGPEIQGLAAGKEVTAPGGMLMTDFTSTSLNRTFEKIYFVGRIQLAGAKSTPGPGDTRPAAGGKVEGVTKVAGGYTVAEILAKKDELAGKRVKVRGKVVKFSAQIMRTNWLHLQDGSGKNGTADLTVTTAAKVKVGDLVVIEGTLTIDKDFGAGYKYDAIVEKAEVTKE